MQYVFLVGGFGTRLGSRTKTTPKPLLEIIGSPFLLHLIKWAKCAGAHEVLLLSGYKGDQVEEFANKVSTSAVPIRVIQEPSPLGTGGALINALDELDDEFIVSNGDSWLAFDPRTLSTNIERNSTLQVVMALRLKQDTSSSGIVEINTDNIITNFSERGDTNPGLINAGVYCMRKKILMDYKPTSPAFSIEQEFFPSLIPKETCAGLIFQGYFIDIGTPQRFEKANNSFATALNNFVSNEASHSSFSEMKL